METSFCFSIQRLFVGVGIFVLIFLCLLGICFRLCQLQRTPLLRIKNIYQLSTEIKYRYGPKSYAPITMKKRPMMRKKIGLNYKGKHCRKGLTPRYRARAVGLLFRLFLVFYFAALFYLLCLAWPTTWKCRLEYSA